MLEGPKDKHGLVHSTNIRGYNIKITMTEIKVVGYQSYKTRGYWLDTNEKREADVNEVLRLIMEGRIKKLEGLRR